MSERQNRDAARAMGFVVERLERSKLGIVERLSARKPGDPATPAHPQTRPA